MKQATKQTIKLSAKHYENLPMQCTEISLVVKIENFQRKICDIFLIFAQNIDCGYMLEWPWRGSYNNPQSMFWNKNKKNRYMYTPANPRFFYKKVGSKVVYMFS